MCCHSSCCHSAEGLTCMLVFSVFSAVLAMFQVGYNTGVTNAPQKIIQEFIRESYEARTAGQELSDELRELLWSITVSVFAIGGMIGGVTGGSVADRFGRKGGILLNNLMGIIGASLMGCSKMARSMELLIFGRLIIGFNCGMNTTLVPMYLSEISPLHLRGGLGSINQLALTIGFLLSIILGIQPILGTEDGWPYLLGLAVMPAVLQLLLMPLCPESPRYLLITKLEETLAKDALEKLRRMVQVEEDMEEMRVEQRAQTEDNICPVHHVGPAYPPEERRQITMMQLLQNRSLRLPLFIGIVMQLSQQLSGINVVLYYSTGLFEDAGLSGETASYATVGVGALLVVTAMASVPLMDRAGRRTLHLYGLGGMFIFSIFITISLLVKFLIHWLTYMSVVSTFFFVVFYGIGPGPIPWMITAELFSQGPRPAAMSIAMLVNWFANFISGLVFPILQRVFDNYTFLPFSALLAIFWTFTYRKFPETKKKTFDEISSLFTGEPRRLDEDADVLSVNGMTLVRKHDHLYAPAAAPAPADKAAAAKLDSTL